jgi:hypothetical protein
MKDTKIHCKGCGATIHTRLELLKHLNKCLPNEARAIRDEYSEVERSAEANAFESRLGYAA